MFTESATLGFRFGLGLDGLGLGVSATGLALTAPFLLQGLKFGFLQLGLRLFKVMNEVEDVSREIGRLISSQN